ncbi:hypothetical protein ACOME3_009659 [Neoechinorhynchus agilis]
MRFCDHKSTKLVQKLISFFKECDSKCEDGQSKSRGESKHNLEEDHVYKTLKAAVQARNLDLLYITATNRRATSFREPKKLACDNYEGIFTVDSTMRNYATVGNKVCPRFVSIEKVVENLVGFRKDSMSTTVATLSKQLKTNRFTQ